MSSSRNVTRHDHAVSRAERTARFGGRGLTIWLTGLPGSGKSTVANALDAHLLDLGVRSFVLDGDNVRTGLNRDLGFAPAERTENIRRFGEVARLFVEAGIVAVVAVISPYRADRGLVRDLHDEGDFFEVHVSTPLDVCETRDPKGLYRRARAGEVAEFTGVSAPYEVPEAPELVVDAGRLSVEECVNRILDAARLAP